MSSAVLVTERRRAIRWWRPALVVAGIAVAAFALRGRLPDPASTWSALRQSKIGWLLAAAAFQVISMGTFAEQQRHLLAAFGVRVRASSTLALSYARTAISTALPGGAAVSAGYTFKRYRAFGATYSVAAAVILLSGVGSLAGLALLYAADLLAWTTPSVKILAIVAVGLTVTALTVVAIRRFASAKNPVEPAPETAPSTLARLGRTLRETAALSASVSVGRWAVVIAYSALNWLADLACLLAATYAVGLRIPMWTVATAYLATQLIRQIPITPGGIGVIEASLILALTTAGATAATAAAAVLLYRVLSCWAVLPIGLVCWSAQQRQAARSPSPQAESPDPEPQPDQAEQPRSLAQVH